MRERYDEMKGGKLRDEVKENEITMFLSSCLFFVKVSRRSLLSFS